MAEFSICPATVSDTTALAHIHVAGWRNSYGGIIEQRFLDALTEEQHAADWERWFAEVTMQTLIARNDTGRPAGFISFGKLRTPIPGGSPIRPLYSAEIYAIYILPEFQRLGLGRQLMREAALKLRDLKHRSVFLWALERNEKAVNFYRKLGGHRCGKKDVEIGGTRAKEIAFGWRDISVLCMS